MSETSTTSATDNQDDAASTATTDPNAETDQQTAETSDNLETTSESDETTSSTDDDKSTETNGSDNDAPASQFDEDLDDWIEKNNRPKPETDEQRQVLQDLRNSQREFTRAQQAKKGSDELAETVKTAKEENKGESEDEDDEDDPLAKDVKALKADRDYERTTRIQSEFYQTNKINEQDNPGLNQAILDVFKEETSRAESVEERQQDVNYWSHPARLGLLLRLGKARLAETQSSTVADEAAREERERIARESQANSPGRAATSTGADSAKSEDEQRLERFKTRYNKS